MSFLSLGENWPVAKSVFAVFSSRDSPPCCCGAYGGADTGEDRGGGGGGCDDSNLVDDQ